MMKEIKLLPFLFQVLRNHYDRHQSVALNMVEKEGRNMQIISALCRYVFESSTQLSCIHLKYHTNLFKVPQHPLQSTTTIFKLPQYYTQIILA